MFERILVPTDGSQLAGKAVNAAMTFAEKNNATLFVVSVAEPTLESADGFASVAKDVQLYNESLQQLARKHVDNIAHQARERNVLCETAVSVSCNPYEEIVQASKRFNCDVIFIATHGRHGVGLLFAGSQTRKVLAHATIPVVVFK